MATYGVIVNHIYEVSADSTAEAIQNVKVGIDLGSLKPIHIHYSGHDVSEERGNNA